MKAPKVNILPYDPKFDRVLLDLEREAVQGKWIQLEMLRDHYLSRSWVFKEWRVLVATGDNKEVLGAAATAIVPLQMGENKIETAFAYDARIKQQYQSMGIGGQLLAALKSLNETELGLTHHCYTSKISNRATQKIVQQVAPDHDALEFVYLSIPTTRGLKQFKEPSTQLLFEPVLFDAGLMDYMTVFPSGLKVWHTFKTYRLKIHKVHPLAQIGLSLLALFHPFLGRARKGYEFSFATLFGYSYEMLSEINEVLQELHGSGVDFLNVTCRKGDPVYRLFKPLAVSEYHYNYVSNFPIPKNKDFKVDVRCL